jgi:hypothetical protein
LAHAEGFVRWLTAGFVLGAVSGGFVDGIVRAAHGAADEV